MTNSVDLDQTAPIRAVRSGSTLFASILKFVSNVRQLFAANDFSIRHFSDDFFLGALRVNSLTTVLFYTKYKMMLKGNNYGKSNLYAKFYYCIKKCLKEIDKN